MDKTAASLEAKKVEFISSGIIETNNSLGFSQGLLVRDPDGHGIKIIEQ